MALLEGIGKLTPQLTGIEDAKSLISRDGKVSNNIKDTVSLGGSKVYDTQLYPLREEIDELKQLVNMLVAQEVLAKGGGKASNLIHNNNNTGAGATSTTKVSPLMASSVVNAAPSVNNTNDPQNPNKPPENPDDIVKKAIYEQIKAQMEIKKELLKWDTTLMTEKKEYEMMLSFQQHQNKLMEMTMAAFSKVREMHEQMWLNLKQKEDQLDQQRIKALGGF